MVTVKSRYFDYSFHAYPNKRKVVAGFLKDVANIIEMTFEIMKKTVFVLTSITFIKLFFHSQAAKMQEY